MTVLSACQAAAVKLNQDEPTSLFSSTEQFDKELRTHANDAAVAIAKAYDWQKLMAIHTLTGDGTTTSFALPSDYDRMVSGSELLTSTAGWKLQKADVNEWLDIQINTESVAFPGYWIVIGGTMNARPAIDTGDTVKFYYIKNTIVLSSSSAAQTAFQSDTDTFVLPERLITLGVIWRWRAQKRMEYAEDLKNFEIALSEETATDKGSRVVVVGRRRNGYDYAAAYPRALG